MTDQLTTPAPAPESPQPPSPRRLPRALTPFRHSAYRRLGIALVLGAFAGGVWVVALVWEVIRIGGGAGQLSVVSTAGAVGVLLPALLGGVVADRVPQKLILLVVAAVETTGMAIVALLSWTDRTEVWHLAVVSFATGAAMAFYYPAYSAWLPALVPEEDLMAVNGFEGMVRPTVGQALGPALAGIVVGAVSTSAALGLAAAFHVLGIIALTAVPLTAVRRASVDDEEEAAPASVLADMREGFAYMVRTPWLLATLLFASVMLLVMMGPLEVLIPFLVKDKLDGGPGDHAAVLAAFGIGGAVGSMVMASLQMPRRYLTWMNLMWGLACLPFFVMGIAGHIWVIVAMAFLSGVLFSAPMVIWGTLLQRRVPPHLLGRVASLDFFVSISLMPVSLALAGPVASWIGVEATFTIAAVVPVVAAVLAVWLAKLPADELANPLRDAPQAEPEASVR
ncbi:MFS transporter [Nocardioides silvaticus]|uniref:MFS transporter n=1 Tax=Nocardioides silvaticus TaxID=2201891 RepID=A0A316TJD0_9ACTN|nr:MFS transporter [Nocardioides silvaticus]PWN02444.1 MFS transporter [Nocardioides silvaticus]